MDAIDTTYQNLPNLEIESKTVENEKNNDAIEAKDVVVAQEDGSSFDEVISSMLEAPLDSQEQMTLEENADVAWVRKDSVIEDMALPNDSFEDGILQEHKRSEKVDLLDKHPNVEMEEVDFEDVPFVKLELNVAEKNEGTEVLKEINTKDEKKVKESCEKKIDEELGDELEEKIVVKVASPFQEKRMEVPKKEESKQEEKIEAKEDVQGFDVKIPKKKDKVQTKKLPIVVEDLRSEQKLIKPDAGSASFAKDAPSEDFSSYYKMSSNTSSSAIEASFSEGKAVQNEGHFASILAEQIKGHSAELVERGKIVLQDGNVGEIRLQLKPAHLGSVKIQLKMSGDKKMQGEVTVSSKEAFDAFEESMQDLVASFNEAGFDASGFNLNWKGEEKQEVVREDLSNQYFSPEKTHLSLSERLNFADNIYGLDKAKQLNVLV